MDIRNRFLSEQDAERLYRLHPEMKSSPDRFCPTCRTTKSYKWKGQSYPCDCEEQLQLYKHYLNSGIGIHYQRLQWEDYSSDQGALEIVGKYLESHEQVINKGLGLIFVGPYGVGKTFLTMLAIKELVKLGYTCYATTFTSMIEMFTAGWADRSEQRFFQERIKGSQVLLLDDIGKEMRTKTNLSESTFDDVLRSRVQNGRPTFLTTNMLMEDMKQGYGSAVFSLLGEVSIVHQFSGDDHRPEVMVRHMAEVDLEETRPIV